MEPSLIGWEWLFGGHKHQWGEQAAMEPSLIGWEWAVNGLLSGAVALVPQWSPALSAGNGFDIDAEFDLAGLAAMEPSLIGWEW